MRTPPFTNYPTWSTSKFWSFIRSGLRSKWLRWPPRYECLADARRTIPKNKRTTRQMYEYQCNKCKKWFAQKNVEVDHLEDAGSLKCFDDLPLFVERLFTSKEQLQILCKPCHKEKR